MPNKRETQVFACAAGIVIMVAGCAQGSLDPALKTVDTTTSATASATTNPACTDFPSSAFIGADMSRADEVKAMGWTIRLWDDAGSPSWDVSKPWMISSVDKDFSQCLAKFKVAAKPTIPTPTIVTPPIEPVTPPTPAGPLTTVSDGTYLVGTDMVAGSYKSTGSTDSRIGCYWARLKDDSGRNIIANDYTKGPTRFTTKKGEYVQITNCTFTKV